MVGTIRLTRTYLLSEKKVIAVTPQKRRMIEIPCGFVGFHGSSTLSSRSPKYESIRTANMAGNPMYMIASHQRPIHQSLSPVLTKSSRNAETPFSM